MLRTGGALAATAAASVLVGYAVGSLMERLGERKETVSKKDGEQAIAEQDGEQGIAQRALALLGKAPPGYIEQHIKRLISGDAYHVTRSPEGYICLAISENRRACIVVPRFLSSTWTPSLGNKQCRWPPSRGKPCPCHHGLPEIMDSWPCP